MALDDLKVKAGDVVQEAYDLGKMDGGNGEKIYSQAEADALVAAAKADLKAKVLEKLNAQQDAENQGEAGLKGEIEGL